MIRLVRVTIGLLLGIGMCTSCSNQEIAPPSTPSVPLSLKVNVAGVTQRAAFVDTSFPKNSVIGVGLISDGGSSTDYNQSSVYILQSRDDVSETWSVKQGINGLFLSANAAWAIAYYPAGSNSILTMDGNNSFISPSILSSYDMGDLSKYTVGDGVDVQIGDEIVKVAPTEVDYMVGKSTESLSSSKPTAILAMNHAMAMVSVRIIKDGSYYGEGAMSSFTIKNSDLGSKPMRKGKIQLIDNRFLPGTEEVSYTRSFTGYYVEENAEYNDRIGFLAFPATIGVGDFNITLKIDEKEYKGVTNSESLTFEAGKLTVLNVTVKANEITLSSTILVEGWTDTTEHEFEVQ